MKIYKLFNEYQTIELLDLGATIHKWFVFKEKINIVINNYNLEDYLNNENGFFGGTIGRYASRIKNASITIDDINYPLSKNNLNKHMLHGGFEGFNLKMFEVVSHEDNKIVFKYVSKDLEEGFPGELTLYVTYEITGRKLLITYDATTTKKTAINITNHVHFNLGDKDILNHKLEIDANNVYVLDDELTQTGKLKEVFNTPLDFTKPRYIKEVIFDEIYKPGKGIDNNFKLNNKDSSVILMFENKKLTAKTSYPVGHIYSMNNPLKQKVRNNEEFVYHMGLAIECMYESDAISHPNLSKTTLDVNEKYHHFISFEFAEK